MREHVRIFSLSERACWTDAHREGGLPSQSWAYAHALSASGVDPKLAVVCAAGARMLLPFFERTWSGATDIATIFGASGATIFPVSPAPVALWREFAKDQGWVAGYIQLSPTLDLSSLAVDHELGTSNAVFLLDLRPTDWLRSASDTIRQKIRKVSRCATLVEDRSLAAESLKRLYPASIQRVRARPHYHFATETLETWALDPESTVVAASIGESVQAVSLFLVGGEHAEYHLNASTEIGRELAAWLIWNATARLRERGVTTLNLGGGVTKGDGLYMFKRRFGGVPRDLKALRQVYDRAKYDELCRRVNASPTARWFPAYRAAIPPAVATGEH